MKPQDFAFLVALAALAPTAAADLHLRSAWLQGGQSPGAAIAHFDLDDQGGGFSVRIDSQGLSGPVTGAFLRDRAGNTITPLGATGPATGVAFGAANLDAAALGLFRLGEIELVVATAQHPQGEIDGPLHLLPLSRSFQLTPGQVAAGHASTATGSGFLSVSLAGEAGFSGQLHGLSGAITSVEIRSNAWHGETGDLLATITSFGSPSPGTITFFGTRSDLSESQLAALRHGLAYAWVATDAFPAGELRGQMTPFDGQVGDVYCPAMPSSVASSGAALHAFGSPRLADDDVVISASGLPANKLVLPIAGSATGHVFAPASLGGLLCVGGGSFRRLSSLAGLSDSQGHFQARIDLDGVGAQAALPGLQPGDRLNLQLWYRDASSPAHANLSSSVSVLLF